jgi:outer membrane protein assembly factor BamB
MPRFDAIVVAVIPSLFTLGPLALLALLVPAAFGGLALAVRRWLAVLSIASLGSTLYLGFFWFQGYLRPVGWDSSQLLWGTLALVASAGTIWAVVRARKTGPSDPGGSRPFPTPAAMFVLATVSLVGLGVVGLGFWQGKEWQSPWKDLLPVWAAAWAGALAALFRRLAAGRGSRLSPEGVMLGAAAMTCAGLAAEPAPPPVPGPQVEVVWTFEPAARGAIITAPLVTDDRVYVAAIHDAGGQSRGTVYCLRRQTGKVVWKFDDHGAMQQTYSAPCLAEGRLYVGEGMHENFDCKLYCLDAASGKKLWDFSAAGHVESSPCVAGGRVFVGAGDDGLYCLDAATGRKCWQFQGPFHIDTSPAVADGRVYFGSGTSRQYRNLRAFCLDARTGKVLWEVGTDLPVWGSPRVAGEQVFFGLGNGRLLKPPPLPERPAGAVLCLDAATGRTCWRCDVGGGVFARPAVDADRVYFGCADGCCYAADRRDGRLFWRQDLGSPVLTAPAPSGSCLYVAGSGGQLYRLATASGAVEWSFDLAVASRTRPRLLASPVVLPGVDAPGDAHTIFLGTELINPVTSAAVLYCFGDS